MHILIVYIPETYAETVKESLFSAGAGKLGAYERCSFDIPGTGQFSPLPGSDPFIGGVGILEKVREVRVEMVVPEERLDEVLKALRESHPYEVPAYHYYKACT